MLNKERSSALDIERFFYPEMLAHPVLFTHPSPHKVALFGQTADILAEVLKHPKVAEICCVDPHLNEITDPRITHYAQSAEIWLTHCPSASYDIIIETDTGIEHVSAMYRILETDGILVKPCSASLLDISAFKMLQEQLQAVGFHAFQALHFAQPSHATRWPLLLLAAKRSIFRAVREREVFNRQFKTHYYNYDVHKAALALPEFVSYLFHSDTL